MIGGLLRQLGELHAAKTAAEEERVATSRFLAAASHDLRQPLHALEFFVDALEGHPVSAGARDLVGNIRQSVRAVADLLQVVLDISRLDGGVVQPSVRSVPVSSILERVCAGYEPLARRKGLRLAHPSSSLRVRTDPALLERIVHNLVSNAVRYTDRGGIVIGCRRSGDCVRIEVWDSGHGIPRHQHREIFKEFGQLENPERDRNAGLGLGLAIADRLCRLLGHSLTLRSEPGRGSVFAVTVPRDRATDPGLVELPEVISTQADVAGSVVLVVDDDLAVREAMQTRLDQWGCHAVLAASGADMRRKMKRQLSRAPDLIVTEYRLRCALNGVQLVRRLREEFAADVPAVILTGDTSPAAAWEAHGSGLPVLYKPLRPARLRALIASVAQEGGMSPMR